MASSFSSLCIFFLCLFSLNDAFFLFKQPCKSKRDCKSCAGLQDSSGEPCNWCPRDEKCFPHGAFFPSNPCSSSENVNDPKKCEELVTATYDTSLAVKMAHFCSLVYSNNAASIIGKDSEVSSFRVLKQVIKPCEGYANCSGFLAISDKERAIAVAYRGSEHMQQIFVEALIGLTSPNVRFPTGGVVQKYFNDAFQKVWDELEDTVYDQIKSHKDYKVWVTGYSLGAAMASLTGSVISKKGKTPKNNLFVYTFGQPRVGDYDYAINHDALVPISFRIIHYRDPIVHLPLCKTPIPLVPGPCTKAGPYHAGTEIYYPNPVMTKNSNYKVCLGKPLNEDYSCSDFPTVWTGCFLGPSAIKHCLRFHASYFSLQLFEVK